MKAQIVIGLGYGDEGKGSIVDYLCRQSSEPPVVVRFNGGGQAAHNVVTPEGRHHTFSQVGSGTLAGASTFLSRFMVISPLALFMELEALGMGAKQHFVDERCLVITPYQRELNREQERARGDKRHGSCGIGFGVAVDWSLIDFPSLHAGDLHDRVKVLKVMAAHRDLLQRTGLDFSYWNDDPMFWTDQYCDVAHHLNLGCDTEYFERLAKRPLIFEGAQGVLLDQDLPDRFQPHTTWSSTTFKNAWELLDEINYPHPRERIGVHRAYAVRHGAGPFESEVIGAEDIHPDPYNVQNEWQGPLRYGRFNPVEFEFAMRYCGGVDTLAITCMDHVSPKYRSWQRRMIKMAARQPIAIESWGPTADDKTSMILESTNEV